MKKEAILVSAVVIVLAFTLSTSFAEEVKFSGFLGGPTVYDQLKPGTGDQAKYRWINPKVDLKKYKRFIVDSVIFFLADEADYKGIDPQEMKEMADEFNKAIVEAFRNKWPIVVDPGPDVMRIRVAITNIKPSRPGISAVTSILPVGLGVSVVKRGATGGWVGSGETGAEAMYLDSVTNDIVALGVDQRAAAFDERFTKWGSAKDAFKFWAERTVGTIDNLHGIKREPKK